MADNENGRVDEAGFEYQGRTYPWRVSDMGKDLMLIDRFTNMSITEFFDVIDDENERGRGPILLALIATSLRAGNPEWPVDRIARAVMNLNLSDVEFLSGEETPQAVPPTKPKLVVEPSTSTSTGSSPSSTPAEPYDSPTSFATPV